MENYMEILGKRAKEALRVGGQGAWHGRKEPGDLSQSRKSCRSDGVAPE